MAPLLTLATSLIAETAPELLGLFGSKKKDEVAEKVVEIAKTVTGHSDPDKIMGTIQEAPMAALQFQTTVLAQKARLQELAFESEKLYVNDTQDARKYRDDKIFWLGVIVLASFAIVMGVTLFGLYVLATGDNPVEPNTFAAVVGLAGAIVGYFAANSQQVVGYFFGSSQGSATKTESIAEALQGLKRLSPSKSKE